jgi:RHS repeat-associated protein
MMTKNVSYWAKPALVLAICVLSSLTARCYWHPEFIDVVPAGNSADVTTVLQGERDFRAQHETHPTYYGYRYYNASTGRWLSRDPINEDGGPNLYGFVRNAPLDNSDPLGLVIYAPTEGGAVPISDLPQWPPQNPYSAGVIANYDCSCCSESKVEDGIEVLTTRFNMAGQWLDAHGVKRKIHGTPGTGLASCYLANSTILSVLGPIPRCWICFLEHRYNTVWGRLGADENYIHCFSMGNVRREVVFDWWKGQGVNGTFQGGVYEGAALDDYYRAHPYFPEVINPGFILPKPRDCSVPEPVRQWELDTDTLTELLDGGQPWKTVL